uniref:Uncharacterized protein n=1 Tax=Aegilops tauschii subsp. strangulata TaxID=200361 RepID=A0A453J4H4_AEGTS
TSPCSSRSINIILAASALLLATPSGSGTVAPPQLEGRKQSRAHSVRH